MMDDNNLKISEELVKRIDYPMDFFFFTNFTLNYNRLQIMGKIYIVVVEESSNHLILYSS